MGEWSKLVGETGEQVAGSLLELIGWSDRQENFDIPCVKQQSHSQRTHGIDKLYSYKSPLANKTLNHVVVSVKYSAEPYPRDPSSDFKKHFTSLARSIECFQKSPNRDTATKNFRGFDKSENVRVLFWLTARPDDTAGSRLVLEVSKSRVPTDIAFNAIYVVDNYSAGFIFDTMKFIEQIGKGRRPQFFYCNTGRNFDQVSNPSSGQILPVEFINSPVLVFLLDGEENGKTFIVSTSDPFSVDTFRRLMGLSKEITRNLPSENLILFPDYDPLFHENKVQEVKAAFSDRDFTKRLQIGNFRSGFRITSNA